MSDAVEFLITFIVSVGLLFAIAALFGYFGYTQKPKNKGLLALAGLFVTLAFLSGICTVLFFTMVPKEVRNQAQAPQEVRATDIPMGRNPGAVQVYRLRMGEQAEAMGTAIREVGFLLSSPQVTSDHWRNQIKDQAEIVHGAHEKLTELKTPDEMLYAHRLLLDASSDCDKSMSLLVTGIEKVDTKTLTEAKELMDSCGRKTDAANEVMTDNLAKFD